MSAEEVDNMSREEKVAFIMEHFSEIRLDSYIPAIHEPLPDPEQIRMQVEQDMPYWQYLAKIEKLNRQHLWSPQWWWVLVAALLLTLI